MIENIVTPFVNSVVAVSKRVSDLAVRAAQWITTNILRPVCDWLSAYAAWLWEQFLGWVYWLTDKVIAIVTWVVKNIIVRTVVSCYTWGVFEAIGYIFSFNCVLEGAKLLAGKLGFPVDSIEGANASLS